MQHAIFKFVLKSYDEKYIYTFLPPQKKTQEKEFFKYSKIISAASNSTTEVTLDYSWPSVDATFFMSTQPLSQWREVGGILARIPSMSVTYQLEIFSTNLILVDQTQSLILNLKGHVSNMVPCKVSRLAETSTTG